MKKGTKMSRTVGTLEGLYNHLNEDFFKGELPTPIITVQSSPRSYGHCTVRKVWKREEEDYTYELNISAEYTDREVEEILDTMLHEMIHIYHLENGIQDVSRGGLYHNNKFKAMCDKIGLKAFHTDKYGWNTTGEGNEMLIEYALSIGFYGFEIARQTPTVPSGFALPPVGGAPLPPSGDKKPSSTRKYQCPKCKNSFRATKDINVICGDCLLPFFKV